MTGKRIAKLAAKLGRTAKTHAEREVAMSDLAQAPRKPKRQVKRKVTRTRKRITRR
jgi:hypothetical protein